MNRPPVAPALAHRHAGFAATGTIAHVHANIQPSGVGLWLRGGAG